MVFSSHVFLFYFLPLVLLAYYLSPRMIRHLTLCLFSYLFYGWANPAFVVLMLGSTLVDYCCGLVISRQSIGNRDTPLTELEQGSTRTKAQRIALIVSICSNLSLLAFFKYFNFATDSYDAVLATLGLKGLQLQTTLAVTLPLGISFYTFQSMSYSIDVYRGEAVAIRNPIDFACYVSLFPQLVAGPIIRFSEVDDQLRTRTHTPTKFARGVSFVVLGLTKKVILANPCGKVADVIFDAGVAQTVDAWVGACSYAFQIYFDFSAYSDMAIGLGLMLGFVFPKNFDSPYHSASITEFWRRWHISLSTWLRDYLYIPLGGNRKGNLRTYMNLAIVMLLGGLWHGASWNFVIWGSMHGGLLGLERMQGRDSFYRRLPRPFRVAITFVIVLFTWVFFRANDLPSALQYCRTMLGIGRESEAAGLLGGIVYQPYYVLSLVSAACVVWMCPQTWDFTRHITWPRVAAVGVAFAVSLLLLTTQDFNPFIYFIF